VDPDVIYIIVKALAEGRDLYKAIKPPSTEQFTMARTFNKSLPVDVPFHSGLIKYAKEVGLWTSELQARQEKALEQENLRFENWKPKD
jgi:TRAP-type uncharacterized transport system substrate-binding protein